MANMKVVYLTIDDSPSGDFKSKVDYLSSRGIPAIFFCLGSLMEERPGEIGYAIRKGFVVGNHSYDHPRFSRISAAEARRQIGATDAIIEKMYRMAGVVRPARVFRFPHGDKGTNESRSVYQGLLKEMGYSQPRFENITYDWFANLNLQNDRDTSWTYNSRDYTVERYREMGEKSPYGFSSPEFIFERMDKDVPERGRGLNSLGSNDIVLLHDHELTSDLFRGVMERMIRKPLTFQLPSFS